MINIEGQAAVLGPNDRLLIALPRDILLEDLDRIEQSIKDNAPELRGRVTIFSGADLVVVKAPETAS